MTSIRMHHVALSVRSLDTSVDFYKSTFGFAEVKRFERKDLDGKAVFLKLNGMQIEIWQFDKQIKNKDDFSNLNILGIKHIAFEVDDIEEKYKELKSEGIDISEPRMGASGSRHCLLKDPDGLPIELYEKIT